MFAVQSVLLVLCGLFGSVAVADTLSAPAATEPATPPAAAVAAVHPPHTPAPARGTIQALIDAVAQSQALDPVLVHALIRAESGYNPHAVSPAGAIGLMQVMPETAADYGVHSVERLFDPAVNLHTGMRHLKRLLAKYGAIGPAVMAYNAGEGAFERSGGWVTYPETQRYTHRVLSDYLTIKGLPLDSPQAREHIGLTLRPDMATAGDSPAVSAPKLPPALPLPDAWATRFKHETLPEPKLLQPQPQHQRRLAQHLNTAAVAPLKRRLQSGDTVRRFDTRAIRAARMATVRRE